MPKGVYEHQHYKDTHERFLDKIEETDFGCWLWQAGMYSNGYGAFYMEQSDGEWQLGLAHRAAYRLFVDEIPEGLTIDHLCRIRDCVNPEHLEVVTLAENLRRGKGMTAKWANRTHCEYGHPFSGDNLRIRRGHRECVECVRRIAREGYHKRRERLRS
jgi:hypothetical protein